MTRDNPRERAVLDAAEPLGAQVADTILVCGRVGPHGQTGHTTALACLTYSKKLLRLGGRPHTRSQQKTIILWLSLRVKFRRIFHRLLPNYLQSTVQSVSTPSPAEGWRRIPGFGVKTLMDSASEPSTSRVDSDGRVDIAATCEERDDTVGVATLRRRG